MQSITILILIATIGMSIWLFYWDTISLQVRISPKFKYTTITNLVKIINAHIKNIGDNSSFLLPYNEDQMKLYKNKLNSLKNPSLEQLLMLSILIPNRNVGFNPISNLTKPEDTLCLQLSQGDVGWYWNYGTLDDWSFMFYLVRVDLAPKKVLQNLNYKLGEGTLYFLSFGVGNSKEWHYSPYTVVSGSYSCIKGSQIFESGDQNTVISLSAEGLKVISSFESIQKKSCNINVTLQKLIPAYFANFNGCSPCIGGAGTDYWSYPALIIKSGSVLGIGDDSLTLDKDKGIGWLDHQWINQYPQQPMSQIIMALERRNKIGGMTLGKYIWLNLHIGNTHYVVTAHPGANPSGTSISKPELMLVYVGENNNILPGNYNKYTSTGVTYNQKDCKLQILKMTEPIAQKDAKNEIIGYISYPYKYQITLGENIYILDGEHYGECVTIDLTGNLHYSGSAIVYENNKQVGTGFMEANQFQTNELYSKTSLSYLDLENSYNNLQKMVLGGKSSPAILILTLWVILLVTSLILIIISCVKIYKYYRKKSKK